MADERLKEQKVEDLQKNIRKLRDLLKKQDLLI